MSREEIEVKLLHWLRFLDALNFSDFRQTFTKLSLLTWFSLKLTNISFVSLKNLVLSQICLFSLPACICCLKL